MSLGPYSLDYNFAHIFLPNPPGPDGFTGEFCPTFQQEAITVLQELSKKTESQLVLPNSACDMNINYSGTQSRQRHYMISTSQYPP